MLESVVATILNRVVGAYVENFDPKQLNIGILSGDVKLRNLRLKRAALDKLHLPVNVIDGHVGSLILQIPYSNLKGKPVKILIEDVFLLAAPDLGTSTEPTSDTVRRDYATKLDKLELWELSQRSASSDPAETQNQNFVGSLVTKVIDNLQITIKNIHLRYEDSETVPSHPFATGITLAELSAVSTNKDWVPEFISEVTAVTHKLATLDSLALYWDTDAESYTGANKKNPNDRESLFQMFKDKILDVSCEQDLLRPVNGQGFIKLDKNPATEATPKIKAKLEFEELALSMDHDQYSNLLELGDRFHRYVRTREFRRKRPAMTVKEDPRAWFKYAANTVLESIREKNRQKTWDAVQKRWNDFKRYRELYKKQVFEPLNNSDQKEFDDLQKEYTIDDLMFFRKVAKAELKNGTVRERAVHESKRAVSSWGSWLWGSGSSTNNRPNEPDHDIQFSEEDKRELYEVLDLDEHGNSLEDVSTHQTLLDIEFGLRCGSVQLRQSSDRQIASLAFNGSKAKFVNRADSLLFSISLEDFGIHDHTPETKYANIVEINRKDKGDGPFFWLLFETHPLDRIADYNLFLKSRSVTIVHNARLLEKVIQFFTPDADKYETVDAIVNAANKTVEELREQTRMGLEYALQEHKTLNLQVDVKAPVIVLPLDPSEDETPTVLIDSGSLTVSSDLVKREVLDQVKSKQAAKYTEADWKKLESLMYDRLTITLSEAQIVLGHSSEECYKALHGKKATQATALAPTTLKFLLEISIMPQTRSLTQTRLSISLPSLDLTLADVQYKLLMKVIDAAIPQTSSSEPPDRIELRRATTSVLELDNEPETKPKVIGRRVFELRFIVERADLTMVRGWEHVKILRIHMQDLELLYWMEDTVKAVDLKMRDLLLEDFVNTKASSDLRRLVSTRNSQDNPLFQLHYRGNDLDNSKQVDIKMAALRFVLTPTTILTIYDYVMSTFAAPDSASTTPHELEPAPETQARTQAQPAPNHPYSSENDGTIKVTISLESVSALLNDDNIVLSKLELESAKMDVNIQSTIQFQCRLGAVSIVDMMDSGVPADSMLRRILSIEGGGDLADFRYETYENKSYSSLVYFRSGALQVSLVEEPFGRMIQFFAKFSQMKTVYDQARMMEFNQTIIDLPNNIKFDVVVHAPTVIYPRLGNNTSELLRAQLGEIYLKNYFHPVDGVPEAFVNTINAGIRNVKVTSQLYGASQNLELLDDLDLTINASIASPFADIRRPLAMVSAKLSPVEIRLTEYQYLLGTQLCAMVGRLSGSIGGLDNDEVGDLRQKLAQEKNLDQHQKEYWMASDEAAAAAAEPNDAIQADKLSFQFSAPEVSFSLFKGTERVRSPGELSSFALSSFKLTETSVGLTMNKSSVIEGDFSIKSFTIEDLRTVKENKFPEIVPAINHDSPQFSAHVVGRPDEPLYVRALVDSPKVILALDYLLAMKQFYVFTDETAKCPPRHHPKSSKQGNEDRNLRPQLPPRPSESGYKASARESLLRYQEQLQSDSQDPQHKSLLSIEDRQERRESSTLELDQQSLNCPKPTPPSLRFDLTVLNLYMLLLADPSNANSEAIVFKMEELLLGVKETTTLSVSHIGLFLTQMKSQDSLRLRVIDDFNFSLAVDSRRPIASAELCSIRGVIEPVIVRLSLREIWLILAILNKASALLTTNTEADEDKDGISESESECDCDEECAPRRDSVVDTVKIMGESCTIDFEGFKLVVIGPSHLMPILSSKVKPFYINMKNWSSALRVDGSLELSANVYNFSKSAWEPLIDNFEIGLNVLQREGLQSKQINVLSRTITDIEVTPALLDIVGEVKHYFEGQDLDAVFKRSTKEHEEPYRLINQTGFDIEVKSECQDPDSLESVVKLAPDESKKWSFYDWRLVRENLHEEMHNLALGISLIDTKYEDLHNVYVNSVGQEMYPLRTTDKERTSDRLVVDVSIKDQVKYVTVRSATSLHNTTNLPIEVRLMPTNESTEYDNYTLTLQPGDEHAVPILAVDSMIFVRPERSMGYAWAETPIYWEDLLEHSVTVKCFGEQSPFYIQARKYSEDEELAERYGFMSINLCAPFMLINNLPYDFEFKLFCRDEKLDFSGTVKQTGREYLHVVNRLQLLLLSVQPLEGAGFKKRSEFAIINSRSKEYDVENEIILYHEDGQKLRLQISYVKLPQNAGKAIVISAPYVILNRTAHELAISTRLNRASMPLETEKLKMSDQFEAVRYSRPKMWSFENSQSKSRATFRLDDSNWSAPVNISAVGSLSELAVPAYDRQREMFLGLSVQDGSGRYRGTRIVSVTPRFVICNNMDRSIRLREPGGSDYNGVEALPNTSVPIGFISKFSEREMCVSFNNDEAVWSSSFSMANVGTVHLRLSEHGKPTTLAKIDVALEGATLFVHISETKQWPFSIRNFTNIEFTMFQSNPFVDEEGFESRKFTPIRYRLPVKSQMPYSWDFPAANLKELVLESGGRQRRIQLAEIGELRPTRFPLSDGSLYIVNLSVIADGPKQALVISDYDPEESNYDVRPSTSSAASVSSVTSGNEFVAHQLEEEFDTLGVTIRFKGIGVSYITSDSKELCYLTLRNLELNYSTSNVFETLSWQCQWIQVDNCLSGATEFPVILYPSVLPKTATEMQEHPTFSGSVTRIKDDSYGLMYVKHATVLLQEMTIEVDEGFVAEILRMVRAMEKKSLWLSDEPLLDRKDIVIPDAVSTTSSKDVYFEQLHLQPTQLNISFVRTGQLSLESWFQDEVNYFINAITMTVGNINDAPVQFNALLIENVRTRPELLAQSIETHYTQEFIYQIYKVMGSADIIGNPVGLFNNISSGVMDLFYEPYHGYTITDRPSEFGVGLARGGLSFMKKSVYGVSDSVSKVTGSLSKGLALMTLDSKYANRRQARALRNRPRHALYGLSMGAISFYDSFASGVTGLAKAPLEGAATNGAVGFLEGLGRGLVGLPTKTMIGFLDMTSTFSEGLRNTTTIFDVTDIVRVRLPRVISASQLISPYNPRAAAGQMVLHSADNSKYSKDQYLAHTNLAAGRMIVVSLQRIIVVAMGTLRTDWVVTYDQLASIVMEHSGINLKLHGGVRGPFIPLESESTRKYIYRHISEAVAAFNRRELLLS
ncbi:Vacuolar protein sorting-associated protein 13 [Wickerhamiella sorbophila]|uniref:Vacuolar protein sorting-associated protein 13 n=1 Tax=Wickerhamiella sorbophila TaxID=45607 RepID=A0A2T0FMR8_9ASCO|nr:Vacuolar protein sorting-associated protein 13 [Wickerhamiella sorbophila]PRT56259.1 Vacuolar protein sorting-associated protein 13 [Wickerhamiella sorbophila]